MRRPPSFPILLSTVVLAASLSIGSAHAGGDLQAVKARGTLRCGVSDDIPGFSERDAAGRWRGMNIDFCRAVAAATLGDPQKVDFIPLTASKRFPALQAREIDLLVRNTSWTLSREVLLKVQFPAILYYDSQGFMVAKSARINATEQLKGSVICVEKGTTHIKRLTDYFAARGMSVATLVIDSAKGAADAFFAGRCQAYSSDVSQLAASLSRAPGGSKTFAILPERISREPLAAVVRGGDAEWATLVGWVRHILVVAEEYELTRDNIDARLRGRDGYPWDLISGRDDKIARALGVQRDWPLRALKASGNYGEIYERNLGKGTPLAIERGYNRLWTQGGLMYAPSID